MELGFWAAALSWLDGLSTDGIHLLWTAPRAAGYSIEGFDIERRLARSFPEPRCYVLSQEELDRLHLDLRLSTEQAQIAVRRTRCPERVQLLDTPYVPEQDPSTERTTVGLKQLSRLRLSNPLSLGEVRLLGRGPRGRVLTSLQAVETPSGRGLRIGTQLEINLTASVVELSVASLGGSGHVEVRDATNALIADASILAEADEPATIRCEGDVAMIIVNARGGALGLLGLSYKRAGERAGATPTPPSSQPDEAISASVADITALGNVQPVDDCRLYTITFPRLAEGVRIRVGVSSVLAVALREGKAVATRWSADALSDQEIDFGTRIINRILLYVPDAVTQLTICSVSVDDQEDGEAEGADWVVIERGVQLPIEKLDPELASPEDEVGRAESRLLPGEALDRRAFAEVARTLNSALEATAGFPPTVATLLARAEPEDPFIEIRPWSFTLALCVDATWRRILGFGFRDDIGLRSGEAYDYKVTGRFRRRDLEETFYGFHTVPLGTTLPTSFHLGSLALQTRAPGVIELDRAPPDGVLRHTARKGLAIGDDSSAGPTLEIAFPFAVKCIALEFVPRGQDFEYIAGTTEGLAGLGGPAFSGSGFTASRVDLSFPEPVDRLRLQKRFFLYGVRVVPMPAGDPEEVLERAVIIRDIRFEPTPPPGQPPMLGTTHLQEPTPRGDPLVSTRQPPNDMGFRIRWLPPIDGGSVPVWPGDLAAAPPTDVVGFRVERRRVDTDGAFAPIEDESTLFFGSRRARRDPEPITPGVDLLWLFPEAPRPTPPVPVFMEAQDVLIAADSAGPPPGSLHQYRVFAVDAVGRRSAGTAGNVVRLEKRRPPPVPVGPEGPSALGEQAAPPAGVRARVLQAEEATSGEDQRLLAGARNAIVLEWGWSQQERQLDPFATEFRIYLHVNPPDVLHGELLPPARRAAGGFQIEARLEREVQADEMVGLFVQSADHAFRVAGHGPGSSVILRLDGPATDPSGVPAGGTFAFLPRLDGRERAPTAGWERVGVQDIEDLRPFVIRDRLELDASHPTARVWVGVSAADAEPYAPDLLPPTAPLGGRPGNESRLAVAVATARYRGRPLFRVPPPVPDVPEIITDEPAGGDARARLEIDRLLRAAVPPDHVLRLERLRIGKLLSRLAAVPPGEPDADIRIQVHTAIGGPVARYALANPDDARAFVAQIRAANPGRIANRFLLQVVLDHWAALDDLWETTPHDHVSLEPVDDMLPAQPERYVYRVRLADAAGHRSEQTALLPVVVRVPSLRSPAPPELSVGPGVAAGTVAVSARLRDAFDLRWLVLFVLEQPLDAPRDGAWEQNGQLLRQPNLRDRYPHAGLRLRLSDGQILAPTSVTPLLPGDAEGAEQHLALSVPAVPDRRVAIWGILVTRDGIPSRLAGPSVTATPPPPPVAPVLSLDPDPAPPEAELAAHDGLVWGPLPAGCEAALERSPDGRVDWTRISPWLPPAERRFAAFAGGVGSRVYRLVVRDRVGQTTISNHVSLPAREG